MNLAAALGRALGTDLPPDDEIHIIAVEALDVTTFSGQCTPELEESYPALPQEISAEIDRLIGRPPSVDLPDRPGREHATQPVHQALEVR